MTDSGCSAQAHSKHPLVPLKYCAEAPGLQLHGSSDTQVVKLVVVVVVAVFVVMVVVVVEVDVVMLELNNS